MNTPYDSQITNSERPFDIRAVSASRILPIIGCFLLTGPLIGIIGTIIGMIKAFSRLGDGDTAPSFLAGDISLALMTTLYGVLFGFAGLILVSIALYQNTNREPWFYKCVFTLSILWCILLFPLGLVIGIYLLVAFGKKKHEFYPMHLIRPMKPKPNA